MEYGLGGTRDQEVFLVTIGYKDAELVESVHTLSLNVLYVVNKAPYIKAASFHKQSSS